MARLPALIKTYAELDGRPQKAIEWYARVARETGLISSSKRGVGAAHMTVEDAINLILACNVADEAKSGPQIVTKMRALRRAEVFEAEEPLTGLDALKDKRTLGEALDHLISDAGEISKDLLALLATVFADAPPDISSREFRSQIRLEVTVWRYGAKIELASLFRGPRKPHWSISYTEDLLNMPHDDGLPRDTFFRSVPAILQFELFARCAALLEGAALPS